MCTKARKSAQLRWSGAINQRYPCAQKSLGPTENTCIKEDEEGTIGFRTSLSTTPGPPPTIASEPSFAHSRTARQISPWHTATTCVFLCRSDRANPSHPSASSRPEVNTPRLNRVTRQESVWSEGMPVRAVVGKVPLGKQSAGTVRTSNNLLHPT